MQKTKFTFRKQYLFCHFFYRNRGITTGGGAGECSSLPPLNNFEFAIRSSIFRKNVYYKQYIQPKYYCNLNIKSNLGAKKVHKTISKTDVIYIIWPSKIPKVKSINLGHRKVEKLVLTYFFACIQIGSIDSSKSKLIVYSLVT